MTNICLTTCRACCKFRKDELYFAPKVTKEEISHIKSSGLYKSIFVPFNNSKKVFQIILKPSKLFKDIYVCPYLDEKIHMCGVYKMRPFDCDFWPFILMFDEKKENILIAHYDKNICKITDIMSKIKFKNYLKSSLYKWIKEKKILELVRKYPELIWDYEPDTIILKKL